MSRRASKKAVAEAEGDPWVQAARASTAAAAARRRAERAASETIAARPMRPRVDQPDPAVAIAANAALQDALRVAGAAVAAGGAASLASPAVMVLPAAVSGSGESAASAEDGSRPERKSSSSEPDRPDGDEPRAKRAMLSREPSAAAPASAEDSKHSGAHATPAADIARAADPSPAAAVPIAGHEPNAAAVPAVRSSTVDGLPSLPPIPMAPDPVAAASVPAAARSAELVTAAGLPSLPPIPPASLKRKRATGVADVLDVESGEARTATKCTTCHRLACTCAQRPPRVITCPHCHHAFVGDGDPPAPAADKPGRAARVKSEKPKKVSMHSVRPAPALATR
jgi:hypothetical protein